MEVNLKNIERMEITNINDDESHTQTMTDDFRRTEQMEWSQHK